MKSKFSWCLRGYRWLLKAPEQVARMRPKFRCRILTKAKSKSMHASNNELGQDNVRTATFARTFLWLNYFQEKNRKSKINFAHDHALKDSLNHSTFHSPWLCRPCSSCLHGHLPVKYPDYKKKIPHGRICNGFHPFLSTSVRLRRKKSATRSIA